MKEISTVRFISIGGILTTIAVILQSAPVFLPAIGLALSPLSTLPIAIATFYNISLGVCVYFSSILILILFSVQEALIFLFTTGLLGLVLGILVYRKGFLVYILSSSIMLSLGMIMLTYALSVFEFGNLTNSNSISLIFLIYLAFSIIYVSIWYICLRKFINYLIKIKL